MIKLTGASGESETLSPEAVIRVKEDVCTKVYLVGGSFINVTESAKDVVRKIMEYKIGLIDYKVLYENDEPVAKVQKELYRLAGLEESPDA